MSDFFVWRCGDCGSNCNTRWREYAEKFGDNHRCSGPTDSPRIDAIQALIDHAKKVSTSDRMTVYVGDLEHALGQRDERARTRTGASG